MDAEAEWSAVWNEALATTLFTFIGGGTVAVTGNVAFEELLPPRLAVISLARACQRPIAPRVPRVRWGSAARARLGRPSRAPVGLAVRPRPRRPDASFPRAAGRIGLCCAPHPARPALTRPAAARSVQRDWFTPSSSILLSWSLKAASAL